MPDPLISYPFTEDGLRDALVALGTTDAAITTNLLALECKGNRGDDCHCPTARYVEVALPDAVWVQVLLDSEDVEPYVFAKDADGRRIEAVGSMALAQFIRRFDFGQHPALEVSDESS